MEIVFIAAFGSFLLGVAVGHVNGQRHERKFSRISIDTWKARAKRAEAGLDDWVRAMNRAD